MASEVTPTFETEILTWLQQVKYLIKENWIEFSLLFSAFEKIDEKYQNKKMKTSFGRIIHRLSKGMQNNIQLYTKKITKGKTKKQWVLILLNNDYGIYDCNHTKYKYSTMQLKSMLDYTMIRKCKVGITTLTDTTTNNTTSATNNTTTSTTHNPMADQRTSVDDSTIVPQTVYFMPEVCELDSTPNSHTFQTGIQHQQQHQHESQSPPHLHRITHNQVTPPTDTTYTSYSSPSSSFDFPNLDRETIKNEEVDKMMSGIVERMKIGTADNNLIFEEVALTQKEINSQTTYRYAFHSSQSFYSCYFPKSRSYHHLILSVIF